MRTRRILTESDLHRFVKRAINKVLNEGYPRANGVFDDSQDGAESMQEASFYIERLKSAFAGRSMGAPSEDDVLSGEFTTPNGITIEYENQYPDYIECDAYYKELRSRGEGMSPEAREDIMDEIEHCINAQDGFFTVDFNFDSNANFVRFRVYPFNSIHEGRRMRSARPMLTELDWKTYMNAARGRIRQGRGDTARELSRYASDRFHKQHFGDDGGYREQNDDQYSHLSTSLDVHRGVLDDDRYGSWDNPGNARETHTFGNNGHYDKERGFKGGYDTEFSKQGGADRKMRWYNDDDIDLTHTSPEYLQKKRELGDDLNGYYNGKSRYVKGKGWE